MKVYDFGIHDQPMMIGTQVRPLIVAARGRETDMEVTRRQFLQLGATSTGAAGLSPLGFDLVPATRIRQGLRVEGASVSHSVCPYCAVGCALVAYTKAQNGSVELLQIEGDPDSPVNEGRLCPKGASALQLAGSRRRGGTPLYPGPGAPRWEGASVGFAPDRPGPQTPGRRGPPLLPPP